MGTTRWLTSIPHMSSSRWTSWPWIWSAHTPRRPDAGIFIFSLLFSSILFYFVPFVRSIFFFFIRYFSIRVRIISVPRPAVLIYWSTVSPLGGAHVLLHAAISKPGCRRTRILYVSSVYARLFCHLSQLAHYNHTMTTKMIMLDNTRYARPTKSTNTDPARGREYMKKNMLNRI